MEVEERVVELLALVGGHVGQALESDAQRAELLRERGVAERRDVDQPAQLLAALADPALRVLAEALRLGPRPALRIVAERHRGRA